MRFLFGASAVHSNSFLAFLSFLSLLLFTCRWARMVHCRFPELSELGFDVQEGTIGLEQVSICLYEETNERLLELEFY